MEDAFNINVKMGTNVRDDPTVKRHRVSKFIIHPNYANFDYDAALIKLEKPIFFTNKIRTICLPNKNVTEVKLRSFRYCVMTGLGWFYEGMNSNSCNYKFQFYFKYLKWRCHFMVILKVNKFCNT